MSRATGTFHKPSPFQFPRAPLSPPDTNVDAIGPSLMPYTATHLGSHELRPNETELPHARSAPAPGDAAAARFKKISSIAYQSSGIKESRERTPQRAPRGFVIIIPPNSLIQEHGQLGNTLASGPRHRLSNGLLMPLFPTMFGQLTAIAREFNFPSTAGLCLYPHFVENGVTATPRISDEYWPFIWAHAFEASPASKSLISGKIEFDFDLRQARWYTSWLASSHRDNIEHPITILSSAAPAFVHNRADSKTTFPEDDQEEIRSIGTTTRHVPRKLSLVDRYDILSVRSGSRPASRSGLSPPEHPYPSSRVLSPIFQDEEPKSARHDLDHRVNSWRSSAILQSTPMAAVRQQPATSVSTDENVQDGPLKLEDFAWSVTSAGPDDYDTLSLVSWDRVPSVHIANRVEGSVCLTQSDRTSFGPSDYTLPSPEPSHYRLPSPDLAYRMLEDAPLTPSTATSWGAPLEFPSSPVYLSRPPSVDLGERAVFSRPVTPATATSWGPSSCPPSPIYTEYTSRSIHLGDRGDFSRPVTPSTATSWGAPLSYPPSPVTPFYVSSPDAGHRGFEDTDIEPGMPDPFGPGNACAVETSIKQNLSGTPWGHSWPYRSKRSYQNETRPKLPTIPWKHFWPYRNVTSCAPQIVVEAKANASFGYPLFVLYPPVYPHFDLYPANVVSTDTSQSTGCPLGFDCNSATYAPQIVVEAKANASFGYPRFVLYPPVYPHFDLYPANVFSTNTSQSTGCPLGFDCHSATYAPDIVIEATVNASSSYPRFVLYPPVYPHFDLYPGITFSTDTSQSTGRSPGFDCSLNNLPRAAKGRPASVASAPCYPEFNLYPAVYPDNLLDIYPPIKNYDPPTASGSASTYPYFHLYPQACDLPTNRPRAALILDGVQNIQGYPDFNLYPAINDLDTNGSIGYLYPPVEPTGAWKLHRPTLDYHTDYPTVQKTSYPFFNLYPAVYPYLDIYPAAYGSSKVAGSLTCHSDPVLHALKTIAENASDSSIRPATYCYPVFDLYPALTHLPGSLPRGEIDIENVAMKEVPRGSSEYPHFELYPSLPAEESYTESQPQCASSSYPSLYLYPPVYPFFDIYPSSSVYQVAGYPRSNYLAPRNDSLEASRNAFDFEYPVFNLYPAVYPHFELYPAISAVTKVKETSSTQHPVALHQVQLPIDVPHPETKPERQAKSMHRLTHRELHAMVMMERVQSTGSFESIKPAYSRPIKKSKSHDDLHRAVFPDGMVATDSGTGDIGTKSRSPSEVLRHRISSLRPNSARLGLPASPKPSEQLPPLSRLGGRLSSAFDSLATSDFIDDEITSSSRPIPGLGRSVTLMKGPTRSAELSRTTIWPSPDIVSPPRRRDSLVSQRIRAYNNGSKDEMKALMETLSEFPAPPIPRVTPESLNDHKHAYPRNN